MIEIVLDENPEHTFLNAERPVYTVSDSKVKTWEDYRKLAANILMLYGEFPVIIIRNNTPDFSINWFAVALFVESCFVKNKLECAVFKVGDKAVAIQAYKPFVALTIGLKYIIRLYQEELDNVYKEIAGLSYLGLTIKEDYLENKLYMELSNGGEEHYITAQTTEEALTAVAILKSVALTQKPAHIRAEILKAENSPHPDIDKAVAAAVSYVQEWIN